MWIKSAVVGGMLLGTLACVTAAQTSAPPATPDDRVAMVKDSFAASKKALLTYEWVETVALSLGGEEKVRQQYQCYYGAEGGLQKIPLAADAKEDKKRGLRGKAVESKKAELEASLKDAVALLSQYAPLDPAKIQAAKDAGNVSVSLPAADGKVRVTIKNYLKPGDEVGIDIDSARNTLQTVSVTTFVEGAKDKSPVAATVIYSAFPDGTIYPTKEGLAISAQDLNVDIQNSGYRKHGQ